MSAVYQLRPDRDLTVLIPARAGSKRVPNKNTRMLGGKPLLQWSIESARAANVNSIIVSTDSMDVAGGTAVALGCRLHERKPEHATDESPDIEWVLDVLPMVATPYVAICRPTSPFRTASTIRRCYAAFRASRADSIRAVTKITHPHPAKMWTLDAVEGVLNPVMEGGYDELAPWHSRPTQSIPVDVYLQNASLEMTSVSIIRSTKTISGYRIAPFFTERLEGFDLNTLDDWEEAERLLAKQGERPLHGG